MYLCSVTVVLCTFMQCFILREIITSGKNHFHEMNGDVGMAGWKDGSKV